MYAENKALNTWQGVNALALLARAQREGITVPVTFTSAVLAQELLEKVRDRLMDDAWALSTMSEVCLALGQADHAELWLYRLLYAPECTAFMLESYARQLREIWGARTFEGGARSQDKLASIIARHQMARLSVLSLAPPASLAAQRELEKNFTGAGAFSVASIKY